MKKIIFSIMIIGVSVFFSEISLAYNIYNKSDNGEIEVWGEYCPACFHGKVRQGEHKSCPGDKNGCKGNTAITFTFLVSSQVRPGTSDLVTRKCSRKVPAHGWVEIGNVGMHGAPTCIVYDKKGKELNPGDHLTVDP